MPKISVIIPVYKAAGTLRRCVESIIFGEEQDLEVILIEDRSPDSSWEVCQQLAQEYSHVRCLQNDQNRGVSYTRNRGIDVATGQYVLFVDSDDWVSGDYAKTLIDTLENNPGKMVVCGFTFVDHITHTTLKYGIYDHSSLSRSDFMKLPGAVMLQQLWNKAFCLEEIRAAGLRFNEALCMGEDYQFVLDAIEAFDYQECVIIRKPLYYYVRYTAGSLMNNWAEYETYDDALKRQQRLETLCGITQTQLEEFNSSYAYRIVWESSLPQTKKVEIVQSILGKKKSKRFFCIQKLRSTKRQLRSAVSLSKKYWGKLMGKLRSVSNQRRIQKHRRLLHNRDISIISQNCIGGVFSHDMQMEFQSPTINLFMEAADYIKFVCNLEHYLNVELILRWGEEYPIGMLDDIKLMFVHYDTCQQARQAWERRKKRVNLNKVLVLATDRDGFDEAVFEQWKKVSYPKLLFTAQEKFSKHPDSLYFPEYQANGCVPDLIPKREFYKENMLVNKANDVDNSNLREISYD
jgi:uncharacterized protein (DUF1919 family)